MWSKGAPGAWFEIDLKSFALVPTHFAYRNDYGGGGNHPRTFALQGSADGRKWTTLSRHNGESWSGKGAKHWAVNGCENAYSRFRILNRGSPNHLCCSGIEFYGRIVQQSPRLLFQGHTLDDLNETLADLGIGSECAVEFEAGNCPQPSPTNCPQPSPTDDPDAVTVFVYMGGEKHPIDVPAMATVGLLLHRACLLRQAL